MIYELQLTFSHKTLHPGISTQINIRRSEKWTTKLIQEQIDEYTNHYCEVNRSQNYQPEDVEVAQNIITINDDLEALKEPIEQFAPREEPQHDSARSHY